jgi:hypothetical protein
VSTILERLAPPDLPGQVQALVDALARVAEDTHRLAELSAASTIRRASPEPILIYLEVRAGVVTVNYRTSQAINIVGIVASGDTAGAYGLLVNAGAAPLSIVSWRLSAAIPNVVMPLGGGSHIAVDRGLPLALTFPAGANCEATLLAYARAEDQT